MVSELPPFSREEVIEIMQGTCCYCGQCLQLNENERVTFELNGARFEQWVCPVCHATIDIGYIQDKVIIQEVNR